MGQKTELTSDDLFSILMETYGNLTTPTAGQFRTFLQEKKGIEVEYARAQVAVARLKRNRASSEGQPVIKPSNTARSSRTHGKA